VKYIDDLVHWVNEREKIRIKRLLKRPAPWTDDPILANNRFCNVRREHDKVTRYIHDEWLPADTRHIYTPFALCVARLVNWPDTLRVLKFPRKGWDQAYQMAWLDAFDYLRINGEKAWTGAYMVTGGYSKGGEPKEVIIKRVLDGAWSATERFAYEPPKTLDEAYLRLLTPGIGTFLAAQIVADLKMTPWLEDADDYDTWCSPGPGSLMGLNFIWDRPRTYSQGMPEFQREVRQIQDIIHARTGQQLCAQNTQNCLCELSKYVRAKYFNERLKNTYHAPRNT
jgi:hypothetical protein